MLRTMLPPLMPRLFNMLLGSATIKGLNWQNWDEAVRWEYWDLFALSKPPIDDDSTFSLSHYSNFPVCQPQRMQNVEKQPARNPNLQRKRWRPPVRKGLFPHIVILQFSGSRSQLFFFFFKYIYIYIYTVYKIHINVLKLTEILRSQPVYHKFIVAFSLSRHQYSVSRRHLFVQEEKIVAEQVGCVPSEWQLVGDTSSFHPMPLEFEPAKAL